MGRLSYVIPRCFVCGVHLANCVCDSLPRLSTQTQMLFVQHSEELRKPTSTVPLACHILSSARSQMWDRQAPPTGDIVLYPAPGAIPLQASDILSSTRILIPDGTWAQASRIGSVLAKRGIPIRSLTLLATKAWSVRHVADPSRISSAEAAAEVLLLAGEGEAAETVRRELVEATRRNLALRGLTLGTTGTSADE